MKAKVDSAMLLLDDLQLDESDSASPRYQAIGEIKKELEGAQELMVCRLDLIEKADTSKVGWSAAPFYEKSNGAVLKTDSDKLWSEAEKKVQDDRKKERTPFRSTPAKAGKFSTQHVSRGSFSLYCLRAFRSGISFSSYWMKKKVGFRSYEITTFFVVM